MLTEIFNIAKKGAWTPRASQCEWVWGSPAARSLFCARLNPVTRLLDIVFRPVAPSASMSGTGLDQLDQVLDHKSDAG